MGVTMRNKLGEVSARTKLIFVIVTMSIAWFIGLLLFIIGILLIVGVFGYVPSPFQFGYFLTSLFPSDRTSD